jgi:hypothetical protein
MVIKENSDEYAYFCIMDISTENTNEIFEKAHKAIAPILLQGHVVDYMVKGNSFADIMNKYGPIYKS